ncbi:MAG: DUF3786 domain-containing protein [Spirochaetes bacterium]|nr:DUF3786 domain-containing protein [Spirochaetota bacterium]
MVLSGEEHAWDLLAELDPEDVQTRANVIFDHEHSTYRLLCFGRDIYISMANRNVFSNSDLGKIIVSELIEFSRIITILRYLIHAKEIPLSGKLVRPSDLPGGEIFLRGTHVLPLDKVAEHFGNNPGEFLSKGRELGGTQLNYGDVSLKLFPFPRVPIVLIVWSGDEEFPSRSSLLFDSSCLSHLPTDVIWSTAMMSVEMMLFNAKG